MTFIAARKALAFSALDGIAIVDNNGTRRATMALLPVRDNAQQWVAWIPGGPYVGSARAEESIRWRLNGELLPGDRFVRTLREPGQVQLSLAGRRTPEVFRENDEHAGAWDEARERRLSALTAPEPTPATGPRSPTQQLRRVLSDWDSDAAGTYQERTQRKITTVRDLLAKGADPNTAGVYGTTPLMLAAGARDLEFARELLRRKVELNLRDVYGSTALHEAAEAESPEMVQLLLDAGAELSDPDGRSLLGVRGRDLNRALARAVTDRLTRENAEGVYQNEGHATAWLLLYLGADPNTRDAEGKSLLNSAFYPWLLRMLLRKGADPNFRAPAGAPPLVEYAMRGQLEPIEILLEGGADPNVGTADGWTALTYAAQNQHFEIAKLLIQNGAQVNHRTNDRRTALHLAVGNDLETVRLLLEHGADPNVVALGGYTPLEYAVACRDAEAVKLLLKHGANAQIRTSQGKTLLQLLKERDPKDHFGIRDILLAADRRRL